MFKEEGAKVCKTRLSSIVSQPKKVAFVVVVDVVFVFFVLLLLFLLLLLLFALT